METKFILKSKTIIGLVIASLAMWAPTMGLSFTEADGNFVMSNLDQIIATVGVAYAAFGRIVADTKVRFSL